MALTGCGDSVSNSVYWEDWFETEGYVKTTSAADERTGGSHVSAVFVPGPHPEDAKIAVRHEHKYTRTPITCTFKVQKLTTDLDNDIVDEYVTDEALTKRFSITKTPFTKIVGFMFYCDDEYVYVVNDLYKYNYVDHSNSNPRIKAEYRFYISINGMQNLKLDMDYKVTQSNKPY